MAYNINYLIPTLVFLFGEFACSQSSVSRKSYQEDLTLYRPRYTSVSADSLLKSSPSPKIITFPSKDVIRQINARIDSIASRNKKMKFAQGFRVLIYSGSSSEEMKKIKLRARALLKDEEIYDEYKQPVFRVKIGDSYSRLDAYYILNKLQKDFPNAIVVPDQINISREN